MHYKINDFWIYSPRLDDNQLLIDPTLPFHDISQIMLDMFNFVPITELWITENDDGPMCLYNKHEIYLNTEGNRFVFQNMYQFAHEICHYIIREKSGEQFNNNWFEESICELSSIYYIRQTQKYWIGISQNQLLINGIDEYVNLLLTTNYRPFNLSKLSDTSSFTYQKMNSNPYEREFNRYIALRMLPIFESHPEIWEDIHYIKYCTSYDLTLYFDQLIDAVSNKNKENVRSIKNLFIP